MRFGIIGLVLLVLIVAALLQNVYIGGLILVVFVVLLITGKLEAASHAGSDYKADLTKIEGRLFYDVLV